MSPHRGMRLAANESSSCMMGGWDASAEEGNQYGCSSSSPMVLHEIQVEMAAYQSSIREGKKSMTQAKASPEIGKSIRAGGVLTNYHEAGSGTPVILIHGSGPGVSAWAKRAHLVGNSMGAAVALAAAVTHPEVVDRLVLMGAMGVHFQLRPGEGLDAVWGYTPSVANMRRLIDIFAYDPGKFPTDQLAELRYEASIRPGAQEAFSSMFPQPRQEQVDALAAYEDRLSEVTNPTLIVHGREDRVIPLETSLKLLQVLDNAQLHVFGHCGHWTQLEPRAAFNRLVRDFLTEEV